MFVSLIRNYSFPSKTHMQRFMCIGIKLHFNLDAYRFHPRNLFVQLVRKSFLPFQVHLCTVAVAL